MVTDAEGALLTFADDLNDEVLVFGVDAGGDGCKDSVLAEEGAGELSQVSDILLHGVIFLLIQIELRLRQLILCKILIHHIPM